MAGPIINPSNGHGYYLLEPTSWTNAEARAVSLGGHLVTIQNLEENVWVYNTFSSFSGASQDLWIGLYLPDPGAASANRDTRLAQFRWISNQPVEFRLLDSTNLILSGYCQLNGPAHARLGEDGRWTEQIPSVALSSVVELPLPLEIVSQPKSISVGIGADAVFQVFADGTTPLSYQWLVNGTNLQGQTQATLTLSNVQPNESGSFSVIVGNASGSITSAPAFFSVSGLVAWGALGIGDSRTNIPSGLTSVAAISAGSMHDLALRPDGSVVTWGDSSYNRLALPPDLTNVVAIAGSFDHSLALEADGTVVSWGYDIFTGNWVPAGLTNVIAIDASAYHSLALKADGTVISWGGNGAQPSVTPAGLVSVVAISAGNPQNFALKADGTVVSWDDTVGESLPIPSEVTNVVALSGGEGDCLALRGDGTVVGWGQNWEGQRDIPPGLTNVVAIDAKEFHSLALKSDGTVVGWGYNYGEESTVPAGLPNVVAIACGFSHSLALLRDGTPNVTVQPWDHAVPAGGASTFSAKVVGLQSMKFQWQFNGQPIPGASHDSLSITNVQPSDAGLYMLSVSNRAGVATSRRAKLVVAPAVLLQVISMSGGTDILDVTGAKGRTYVLQASADLNRWVDVQTNSGTAAPFRFSVPNSSGAVQRFYRVRLDSASVN